MKIKYLAMCCAAIAGLSVTVPGLAQSTATGSMEVKIAITANCAVTGTSTTLDFGSQASTTADASNTGGFSVTCTNLTPYKIGLQSNSSGAGTGGTGVMSSTAPGVSQTIGYQLYQDTAHTMAWGNATSGTLNVVSSTGTGATQAFAVYGKTTTTLNVPAATYTDTVAINVYY